MHADLVAKMGLDGAEILEGLNTELKRLLSSIQAAGEISPPTKARVMALGELMSTSIGAAYLRSEDIDVTWTDARDVLVSIEVPGENERSGTSRARIATCWCTRQLLIW